MIFPTGVTGGADGAGCAEGQWWALDYESVRAAFLTAQGPHIELHPP
jgi:hypothetical protein